MPGKPILLSDACGSHWAIRKNFSAGGNAPTLLFLHGFTGSGLDFLPLATALGEDKFNSICIDLPGHGSSAAPGKFESFGLENVVATIHGILQSAPDPSKVVLCGYSMGARIGLHYLVRNPSVRGILISGSPGLLDQHERWQRISSDREWIQKLVDPEFSISMFCGEWESQPIIRTQTMLPQPLGADIARRRRCNDPMGLANALKAWGTGALPSLWSSLDKQIGHLLIVGEQDTKFISMAERMRSMNTSFELCLIPSSGHAPHLENIDGTAIAIADYLSRHYGKNQSSS